MLYLLSSGPFLATGVSIGKPRVDSEKRDPSSRFLLAIDYKGPKRRLSARVSVVGGVVLTLVLYLLWQVGVPPHLPFLDRIEEQKAPSSDK